MENLNPFLQLLLFFLPEPSVSTIIKKEKRDGDGRVIGRR